VPCNSVAVMHPRIATATCTIRAYWRIAFNRYAVQLRAWQSRRLRKPQGADTRPPAASMQLPKPPDPTCMANRNVHPDHSGGQTRPAMPTGSLMQSRKIWRVLIRSREKSRTIGPNVRKNASRSRKQPGNARRKSHRSKSPQRKER
jgi:hypothetical protein